MNTFKLLASHKSASARAVYILYILLGIFFAGITLFTAMRAITQANLATDLPPIFYAVIFLYIVPPTILAYGFLTARTWLVGIIGSHLVLTLLTAGIFMPLTDQTANIAPTLISSLLYWALLIFTYTTRSFSQGSIINWFFIAPYILALVLSIILRNLIY